MTDEIYEEIMAEIRAAKKRKALIEVLKAKMLLACLTGKVEGEENGLDTTSN